MADGAYNPPLGNSRADEVERKGRVNTMAETIEERAARDERRREAVRQYATGDLSWRDLQAKGIRRYGQVLADLADMQLDVPILPLEGRNADLRQKGIAWLEEAIDGA
uniref:Uncharacterized protein n=1 Tax=Bosea sp. NBC_00436 TaxID=2969620 RepID=A0A9E7ZK32_9HYPH